MIVRRVLKCGAEVGRYIEVTKKTAKGYYGKTLRSSEEFFIAETLNNFKEVEVVTISVGKVELEALKHAVHVHHELTPQWEKVLEKRPEIIKVWNLQGVVYIWPAIIKRRIFGRVPNVYIEIKSREYESKQYDGKRKASTRLLDWNNSLNGYLANKELHGRCQPMKHRKPGQIAKVSGKIVRCKKREYGCEGCVFNDILLCPCIVSNHPDPPDCIDDGIIFINV